MISPSSSISNLSASTNKKFKSDDTTVSEDNNTNTKVKILNGLNNNVQKSNELNDVTNNSTESNGSNNSNSENNINSLKLSNGGMENSNGVHTKNDILKNEDDSEPMDESVTEIENGENVEKKSANPKIETEEDNDCEMIDETELKPVKIPENNNHILKNETKEEEKFVTALTNGNSDKTEEDKDIIKIEEDLSVIEVQEKPETKNTSIIELSTENNGDCKIDEESTDEYKLNIELKQLNKLVEIDRNNKKENSEEIYRSKRSHLKMVKSKKLKQLQIDLKNEEAKLILLKRLYYSQRITTQPLTAQQQLLKQQQMQHAKNAQLLKNQNALNSNPNGQIPGQPGQQRSVGIMGNKSQPSQLSRAMDNNISTNRNTSQNMLQRGGQSNNTSQNTNTLNNNSNNIAPNNAKLGQNNINSSTNNSQSTNMQRNSLSNVNNSNTNNRGGSGLGNQGPLNNRNLTSGGAASPANRLSTNSPVNTNSKMHPSGGTAGSVPSVQNQNLSTISPSSAFSPKVPEIIQKPVVSQAAVSQLVRKELEKSLAQIEFPKPPIQDIYFLPNTNNSEFLMCLGLEEVAKCVQEHLIHKQLKAEIKESKEKIENSKENDENNVPITKPNKADTIVEITYDYPNFCAQCSTDFSPVWRTDKNGVILCEKCLKNLEKKQIKTEHNARLKQAFLKAVKDKEIFEKQLMEEQKKALEAQRAARAANPPIVNNGTTSHSGQNNMNNNNSNSVNSAQRTNSNNMQNRSVNSNNKDSNANSNRFGSGQNNSSNNMNSRQQQQQHAMQAAQQRRSLQSGQNLGQKPGQGQGANNSSNHGQAGRVNNVNNNMKSNTSHNVNRSMNNSSGNQHGHGQNHPSMQQKKTDQQSSGNNNHQGMNQQRPGNQGQSNQRSRQSTGNNQNQANNQQKNILSRGGVSSGAGGAGTVDPDSAQAQLQAQAAQLQLAAAFANTPALAAFAQQQQQQQQQAAILQRLMASATSQNTGNFNPLQSLAALQSPASQALNYLNMFPNQKQWKNP